MVWWYVAVFVAGLLLSYAMQPKPESRPPAGLSEIKAPTAEPGREIPVLFGTRDIESPNVVWYGNLGVTPIKKRGGKK